MAYNKYPGVDEDLDFPPAILERIAESEQLREKIIEIAGDTPGGGGSGVVIKGILNPGELPTSAGVWARRIAQ